MSRRTLFPKLGFNFLLGIGAEEWWALLRENRFAIQPRYLGRAALISAASVLNSFFHWRERRRFGAAVLRTQIVRPPLFILGHWRSGTTLLHHLLALDTEQFTTPNTYQAFNPLDFLTNEARTAPLLGALLPPARPGDDMAISIASPQEDEFALALSSLCSPYLSFVFPGSADRYARHLTLRDAPEHEVRAWKAVLVQFVQKLTLKRDRAVLLKSPAHTARVRTLLDIFPDARFVHVHRHPFDVFRSAQRFFAAFAECICLQRPDAARMDEQIIERYRRLHDAFFEDRDLIPHGRLVEVSFEALEANPLATLEHVYAALDFPGFASVAPRFAAHLDSVAAHRKNIFPPLEPTLAARLAREWARCFSEWGYEHQAALPCVTS